MKVVEDRKIVMFNYCCRLFTISTVEKIKAIQTSRYFRLKISKIIEIEKGLNLSLSIFMLRQITIKVWKRIKFQK